MTTVRRISGLAGAVVLLVGCAQNSPRDAEFARQVNDGLRERLTAKWVADTIRRSPDNWLAAVQEVVDDSKCYDPKDGSTCLLRVRVVQYLGGPAGRPQEMRDGWEYWNKEAAMTDPWPNRRIGRKRLVLSVPFGKEADVHGNWIFILDPTPQDVATLRELLRQAG